MSKVSLRGAINSKCRECIYDPVGGSGTWRQQVEQCTSFSCPLWPIRPKASQRTGVDAIVQPISEKRPICPNGEHS